MPNALQYRIVNRANKSADMFIYDDIGDGFFGGISAKQVTDDLSKLGAVDTLNVRFNSGGGSVFEGLAIYNALARFPAKIVSHIDALAASIASVIAMAGSEIIVAENAMIMIHNPYGMALGTADDMRQTADVLDSLRGSLIGIYAKRTGVPEAEVADMMDAETWFTAADAVEHGFANSIVENLKVAASASPTLVAKFRNAPDSLKAASLQRPQMQMRDARLSEMLSRSQTIRGNP